MSGTATIDTTKPAGPVADCADVRANFAAAQAQIDALNASAFMKPATPATVTGSRTDGTALASLLTELAALGLIIDGSTP